MIFHDFPNKNDGFSRIFPLPNVREDAALLLRASAEPLQAASSPIRSLVAPAIVTQTGAGSLGKNGE